MTTMMKRTTDPASSTWKRWMNPQKTEEANVNDICPCYGAKGYVPRTSARDIAISVLCWVLLLAFTVPAAWTTEQWMERESHRVLNHMMIWRESIESWNR